MKNGIGTLEPSGGISVLREKGHIMEFYHRKSLVEPPFSLCLSDATLWDLVRSDRLRPFVIAPVRSHIGPPDPLSGSHLYDPLFPAPMQESHNRLRSLRNSISHHENYSAKSDEDVWKISAELRNHVVDEVDPASDAYAVAWKDFLRKRAEELTRMELELIAMRLEADRLESEFADIPAMYSKLDPESFSHAGFMKQVNEAFFRRDQIESVRDGQEPLPEDQMSRPFLIDNESAGNDNIFRLIGDSWLVKHAGQSVHIKNDKKIRYIVYLLKHKGLEIDNKLLVSAADDLELSPDACDIVSVDNSQDLVDLAYEDDLNPASHSDATDPMYSLTMEEIEKFRSIGEDLVGRIRNDDNKATEDWENYRKYLLKEYGIMALGTSNGRVIFKQKKRSDKEHQKAMKNVSENIKNARRKIAIMQLPILAEHIKKYIHTNIYRTSYRPEEEVDWVIEF